MMKKTFATLTTACFAVALVLGGATVANATNPNKVTICHATSSETNPWVTITVARASLSAHEGHGDLIPAPAGGCPVPEVVVLPVDVPVDPIEPPVEEPVDIPEEPVEEPTEEPTVCAEGWAPGILDENGNPTGCVNNQPNHDPTTPVEEQVGEVGDASTIEATAATPELAYTGSNDVNPAPLLTLGGLLVAAGAFLMTRKKKTA